MPKVRGLNNELLRLVLMHRGTTIFYLSINKFRGLYPFIFRSKLLEAWLKIQFHFRKLENSIP